MSLHYGMDESQPLKRAIPQEGKYNKETCQNEKKISKVNNEGDLNK